MFVECLLLSYIPRFEVPDPCSFVMNISVLSTLVKVTKVLVMNKYQESLTNTKPVKAKDDLSTRIKATNSCFYRFHSKLL